MAFPTIPQRHTATPIHRSKRVSNSSPRKCRSSRRSARESLRSTMMTTGSESMDDEDFNPTTPSPTQGQNQELQVYVQLQRPLSDWVYWQRDALLLPNCWTKVFAVFCGDSLWLYRYADASAKSLLLRTKVSALESEAAHRLLQFRHSDTKVQLCMSDMNAFHRWHSHVSTAVARFPMDETSTQSSGQIVPAVATAMQKKSFWKALATAVVAGAKVSREHPQEDHAIVVYGGSKKSFGDRWKSVTTTLKGAIKFQRRPSQL